MSVDKSALTVSDDKHEFQELLPQVVHSVTSVHSRRAYRYATKRFLEWWRTEAILEPLSPELIRRYRSALQQELSPATVNQHFAAVRKLVIEAGNAEVISARVVSDVLRIKTTLTPRRRINPYESWLTREDAQKLLASPNRKSLSGKRDYLLLMLLLVAGLSSYEIAKLRIEQIQPIARSWFLMELEGMRGRKRSLAISGKIKETMDDWLQEAPYSTGRLLAKISKGGRFGGQGMSVNLIYRTVRGYADRLSLACSLHDLRRTCGILGNPILNVL